jgi:DNA-directed RNA polymerase alpha subunit
MAYYKHKDSENGALTLQKLGFSKYVEILLRDSGITTVDQLMELTIKDLENIKRIGRKSLEKIETKRSLLNYHRI